MKPPNGWRISIQTDGVYWISPDGEWYNPRTQRYSDDPSNGEEWIPLPLEVLYEATGTEADEPRTRRIPLGDGRFVVEVEREGEDADGDIVKFWDEVGIANAPKEGGSGGGMTPGQAAQLAQGRERLQQDREEFAFKQKTDQLDREYTKLNDDYKKAIDEGHYKDAEVLRQRAQKVDEERLRIQFAESARQDVMLNLDRQGQAFDQEQKLRERVAQQASRPSSYLEYAFDSAGVAAPPGTRLAEIQARIKPTPGVEEFLNTQFGGGGQTQGQPQTQLYPGQQQGVPFVAKDVNGNPLTVPGALSSAAGVSQQTAMQITPGMGGIQPQGMPTVASRGGITSASGVQRSGAPTYQALVGTGIVPPRVQSSLTPLTPGGGGSSPYRVQRAEAGLRMPSAQTYYSMNPTDREALLATAEGVGINSQDYAQEIRRTGGTNRSFRVGPRPRTY